MGSEAKSAEHDARGALVELGRLPIGNWQLATGMHIFNNPFQCENRGTRIKGDRSMRKTVALCLLTLAAVATNAFAVGEARITGKVVDAATKQPITAAAINVTAIEGHTYKENYKVDKNGSFAIFLVDGTIKYKFTFTAPGYNPY